MVNFIPLLSFYNRSKHQETSGFKGAEKETTDMEWVNPLTHSH